jgi:hypothetical protein
MHAFYRLKAERVCQDRGGTEVPFAPVKELIMEAKLKVEYQYTTQI